MTAATLITLLRLVIAVALLPFFFLHTGNGYTIALALFVIALATDFLDGYVARAFDQISEFGACLDALVDKVLIYTLLFGLLSTNMLSPLIVFPMFIRDMLVDGLRGKSYEISAFWSANIWGKAKFCFQSVSIVAALLNCMNISWPHLVTFANSALIIAFVVSLPGLWGAAIAVYKATAMVDMKLIGTSPQSKKPMDVPLIPNTLS